LEEKSVNPMDERRKYPRAETNLPISYKNLRTAGQAPASSTTKDLSEGGARFKTSEFISLACRLVLEISIPTSPKPVKAISKVAWIKKMPTGDNYEIGNHFLEITKEDKARILEYVSSSVKSAL
jgi:c-di-GMP-binding flagellar brake protein YcgR